MKFASYPSSIKFAPNLSLMKFASSYELIKLKPREDLDMRQITDELIDHFTAQEFNP